jgi:hypothetical protein
MLLDGRTGREKCASTLWQLRVSRRGVETPVGEEVARPLRDAKGLGGCLGSCGFRPGVCARSIYLLLLLSSLRWETTPRQPRGASDALT